MPLYICICHYIFAYILHMAEKYVPFNASPQIHYVYIGEESQNNSNEFIRYYATLFQNSLK